MDWNNYADKKKSDEPYKVDEFFQQFLNDPSVFGKILAVLVVLVLLGTSFFTVRPEERAVVTRFGRYVATQPPGFHFKLPLGVDRVQYVETSVLRQQGFGFYITEEASSQGRSNPFREPRGFSRSRSYRPGRNLDNESLMLTGDLNVADVNWVVQYKISNPREYLFNLADPEKTIRDISQAAMRQVVGDKSINDVITTGRASIERQAQELTQTILSDYGVGITIQSVKLQDVTPPESVIPSFNEVNAALQEQKQAINQAEAYQNRIIPEARGKAEQVKSEARGYAKALVNRAEGDAKRFIKMVAQYRLAPEITRTRLFIELYEDIMGRIQSFTVVDPTVKGVLPIFSGAESTSSERLALKSSTGSSNESSFEKRGR